MPGLYKDLNFENFTNSLKMAFLADSPIISEEPKIIYKFPLESNDPKFVYFFNNVELITESHGFNTRKIKLNL